ncbi:MAG TPA: LptA/OstA family protein, partial [Bryobacteraceae bacterium]
KAETDRPSAFVFEHGEGTATGASYDPTTRRLLLKNDVKVDWKPIGPNAKLMKIESASLEYVEGESEILLKPWGRLTRENTVVEGENVVIHLQDDGAGHKEIRQIVADKAHGTDEYPNRKLQYSADQLWVDFDDDGVAHKITAQTNAKLVSTSDFAETNVAANHVELNFDPQGHQSILSSVVASGNSVVTSKPLPGPGRQPGETHVLQSEQIEMKMQPGGHEIASIVTHAPGTLEFLPNLPAQHHRTLNGTDMVIAYGPQNRIESFRASGVRTTTDPTADELKRDRNRKPSTTVSRDMLAHFDPKTSHMASMEQWGDFSYEQGDRKAKAAKASLDSEKNLILLDTSARMWDPSGSTSADHIRLDERTGDFTAEGGVNSSRLPDKDQKKNSEMLSGDQPLQAQARKMESTNRNRSIHYEGDVTMWQGANRIQASVVNLDREKKSLVADGNVVTNLWEQPKAEDPPKDGKKSATQKKAAPPVLTVVHAGHLVYTEANRLAVYSGGVLLNRPGMDVKARQLQAFLADSGADSQLEKAIADGAVEIVQTSRVGIRTGTGEHAEYYTDEQKVLLKEGQPKLVERKLSGKQDTTEGAELTYFANDDRLLVNGSPARPGQSRIQRK